MTERRYRLEFPVWDSGYVPPPYTIREVEDPVPRETALNGGIQMSSKITINTSSLLQPGVTEWVYLDYQKGWLGFRIEPEDPNRANTIKACVPSEERKYISNRRTWIVKPKWGPTVAQIIEQFCPGFTIYVAEGQGDMVRALLFGAQPVEDQIAEIPGKGRAEVLGIIGTGQSPQTPVPPRVQVEQLSIRFNPSQSLLNQRYQSALYQWNGSEKVREAAHTIRMSAREYCDRFVDGQGSISGISATTNEISKASRDEAWAEAIRVRGGVEI